MTLQRTANLEIKDFQHALKLAYEYEVDGFNAFTKKYGDTENLYTFFRNYFPNQSEERGKLFSKNVHGTGFDYEFFGALKAVGKLPKQWEELLNAKMKSSKKARLLVILRGEKVLGDPINGLIPRTILPSDSHSRPLAERLKIVNDAYNWALRNVPLEKLEGNLEYARETAGEITRSPDYEKTLLNFIAAKKRFMSRQRLRQRQLRVKKGKGRLRRTRALGR